MAALSDWFFMPYHNVVRIAPVFQQFSCFYVYLHHLRSGKHAADATPQDQESENQFLKKLALLRLVCRVKSLLGFLTRDRPIPVNDSRGSSRSHRSSYDNYRKVLPRQIQETLRYNPKSFSPTKSPNPFETGRRQRNLCSKSLNNWLSISIPVPSRELFFFQLILLIRSLQFCPLCL